MERGSRKVLTEDMFQRKLAMIIHGKAVKLWLAKSIHGRLDVIFSVGTAQGMPIMSVDHIGGYYLLGEGVTPEMLPLIHDLFTHYCRDHYTSSRVRNISVKLTYQTPFDTQHKAREEMVMHVPFAVRPGG